MKKFKAITSIIVCAFILPAYSYASQLGDSRVSLLYGDIQVRSVEAKDWVPAAINAPLMEGDGVWVPEGGRIEVQFRDGTCLRLYEESSAEVLGIEGDSSQFYLAEGQAYIHLSRSGRGVFQLDTTATSVRAYDGSVFRVDVEREGHTDVSVYSGWVIVETRSRTTKVTAGDMLSVDGDGYAELYPLRPEDEWERWNRQRDSEVYRHAYNSAYLPGELEVYSSDLDTYGKWVYTGDYGYVWTPTVMISAGWAPYSEGRWAWIGGDYVWISYEPWGWAPYHYGRWAFVSSIGWCWIPPAKGDVFWGPGYVGWVSTPTYVAWVPLAPGEVYYGYGHYGRFSVDVRRTDIRKTTIRNVYRNVNARNGVTVLDKNDFIRGRHPKERVKGNPFLRDRISLGRPDIRPERQSFMPLVKEIPATKRPPQKLRGVLIEELKKARPLVKDPGASVFTRQPFVKKPATMRATKSFEETRTAEGKAQPASRIQPFTDGKAGRDREEGKKAGAGAKVAKPVKTVSPERVIRKGSNPPVKQPSSRALRNAEKSEKKNQPPGGSREIIPTHTHGQEKQKDTMGKSTTSKDDGRTGDPGQVGRNSNWLH